MPTMCQGQPHPFIFPGVPRPAVHGSGAWHRESERARAQGRRLAVTASSRTEAAAEIHKDSLQVVLA